MKILLVRDERVRIDLEKSADALNHICNTIEFESHKNSINLGPLSSYINFNNELDSLEQKLSGVGRDYTVYVTFRRFADNWFFHAARNIMILSFFGWEHYTNLPLENGLFYFISDALALRIERGSRHAETTGCIYDFLTDKTGVDIGMKMGYICEQCLPRVKNKTQSSETQLKIYLDFMEILNVVSSASRLAKNVLDIELDKGIPSLDWSSFEDEIAQLYRRLGANVKQNVNLAGFQIDILVEEETPSKQKMRSAVECKFYDRKIGNRIVNDFARIVKTLKDSNSVHKGVIVSLSGFSKDASSVSQATGIELLRFEDLKSRAEMKQIPRKEVVAKTTEMLVQEQESRIEEKKQKSPNIFVIMPFSPDLDDVYHLGILEIARRLGCSCERVDEMEFVGDILSKIHDSIVNSKVIIAEVSSPNLNVFYEVGYAHGLKKPLVLITKDISSAPFDLRGYNHVEYKNIMELRKKLSRRLEAILTQPS